jgi:hypothetical protein
VLKVPSTQQDGGVEEAARRERIRWLINSDTCHLLIGCPDFYHILSLNSIILLQNDFLFLYQNSNFFCLKIDTWFI